MHFMRCDTMYVHTHIPSSWEKDQPWTTLSTPTIKVLECLLWTDYVCNNTTGILVGWLGHFVLSLLPSNQDIEGSTEDPDKGLRNRCQLSQERQKPAQGASAVHCLKRLFPEIYFYLKLAAHQSRKRQQSYQWEQLVLVNNEAISPSREQIRGEIINDGEKLSSSYKTARKGPPLLSDLGRCRGWAFLALIKGRKGSGMIWGTQLLPDLRRSQHRQQLYLGLPWWLRRRESLQMPETWVRSLEWEDPLEEDTATTPVLLTGESPWTEEPGGLQSTGSQRVRHNWLCVVSTAHT